LKEFPMPYRIILLMLLVSGLITIGRVIYKPPVEEVAVVMYEYKPVTEVLVNGKTFTITDYN